jgi:hypothetical protein
MLAQPLKEASDFEETTASLKRYPDAKRGLADAMLWYEARVFLGLLESRRCRNYLPPLVPAHKNRRQRLPPATQFGIITLHSA